MSAESEAIFHAELHENYPRRRDAESLRAAAVGHLGASRSVAELTELYVAALNAGDPVTAQAIADELAPVRTAARIIAGSLPGGDSS